MRRPHRCGESLAGDIAQSKECRFSGIEHADKIAREKLCGKNLAGNFKRPAPDAPRSAEPARNLQRVEYLAIKRAGFLRLKTAGCRTCGLGWTGDVRGVDAHPVQP